MHVPYHVLKPINFQFHVLKFICNLFVRHILIIVQFQNLFFNNNTDKALILTVVKHKSYG
ncbi:hypothetical protein LX77_00796 [Gelidibacter algens]|uniref:Uncharacterized protein n=1 Tax=Gelidibacter algens TaxID=49280 RepID=A0A327SBW4_9FLAO|nr:hypothetical protein LX77_00796 [Gelidibacter algens]